MLTDQLFIYKGFPEDELLYDVVRLMEAHTEKARQQEELEALFYSCINRLTEHAAHHGFYGNIWHCYLTNLLVNHENSYSKACEITGPIEGSINQLVLHDMGIFGQLFAYDFAPLFAAFQVNEAFDVAHYEADAKAGKVYNTRIRDHICELAVKLAGESSVEKRKDILTEFYRQYGVGRFGLHKAFRIVHDEQGVQIVPILNITHVYFADLVGYEIPKKKLMDNTDAFVKGRKCNNCLLFGDAGTGKSSSIKAIANEYYEQGLRIIEVYKHQFQDLHDVIAQIKNRNYKFIIYMDDLSFEEFEIEYKYLKAVIEGGLEKKPKNVLIYATSNRRHLVRERFSDKEDTRDDLHKSDTVQEKLSLVARFGVSIYFGAPTPKEFRHIVKTLAKRQGVEMDEETLLAEANKWELSHGGLSGRTAQQFIDYLLGFQGNEVQ